MLKTVSAYINALGALVYKGTWNAATNNPFLQSGVGNSGDYYVVSVAGSTNLDGITDWKIGDWAVFNGATWQKVDNTDQVVSVNGFQGVVVLGAADVGATPNTTYVLAGTGISGGGQLTGNVTITNSGVTSFNTRNGAVTLSSSDVTTALGYTPGSGNGTVTQVATGTGLTGGPITTSGTVALANTAVVAGSYSYASITVDAQGRLTAASNGSSLVTSVGATAPVQSSGGTAPVISMPAANATTSGYLTSTDWSTFNGKQPAGTYVTSVSGTTGRVTSTGGTTPVIDLATSGVTAQTYGNASNVAVITADAYGRITSASNTAIAIGVAAVSGAVANTVNVLAGSGLSGGGALTGNVTLSQSANSTQQLVNVQNNGVSVGTRQSINFIPGTSVTISTADDSANGRANVTIGVSNNVIVLGNTSLSLANTTTSVGNLTLVNANISASVVNLTGTTSSTATFATPSLPLVPEGYITVQIGGVNKKIPYYGV